MFSNPTFFTRQDLPFNSKMKTFWNEKGFLIIESFYSLKECQSVRLRANELIKKFNHSINRSIFNTKNQEHADDKYFLESGDQIRFFFENKAYNSKGNLFW